MRQDLRDRKRLTAALAALTLAVPLAGTAIAGDNGKGDERPESAPGQQKQDPAPSAKGQEQAAEARGNSKAKRPAHAGKPDKAAKPKAAKPKAAKPKAAKPKAAKPKSNPHAKAGKTTICHSTGSATNPFVTITISNNALKAHARHHDGRDIIPAPAAGCPKGEAAAAPAPAAATPEHGQKKVTICHATGSATNPFVRITIAEPAVEAHKRHQNGEDIIPAPEGECPGAAAARAAAPAALLPAPAAALVAPAAAGVQAPRPAPGGAVLGETVSGGPAPSTEAPAPAGAVRSELGGGAPSASASLPFTGLDLWLVVAAGLGALLAGVALVRAAGRHPA